MSQIKICGLTHKEEIKIINQYPVHYAGFIFAESKRKISINTCIELKELLRKDIKTVGVFVNQPLEEVKRTMALCHLDIAQLHGDETVDFVQALGCTVWKVFRVKDDIDEVMINLYEPYVQGILLENHSDKRGGSGECFDWVGVQKKRHNISKKLIVAGGIKPENINGTSILTPDVLDVNSGVEINGKKHEERIRKLFLERGYHE